MQLGELLGAWLRWVATICGVNLLAAVGVAVAGVEAVGWLGCALALLAAYCLSKFTIVRLKVKQNAAAHNKALIASP